MDGVQDSVEVAPVMQSVEIPGCVILDKSFPLPALPCSELFNATFVSCWMELRGGPGGQSEAGSLCPQLP